MKKFKILFTAVLFIFCTASLHAAEDIRLKNNVRNFHTQPQGSYKNEVSDCVAPTAQTDLDINNARARLLTDGRVWYKEATQKAGYEIPKAAVASSAASLYAIYAGAIWISGVDGGGNLKIAAQEYAGSGNDYYTGPLDASGNVTVSTCSKFDKEFVVYGKEIDVVAKHTGGVIADNVLNWPGKGNKILASQGFDVSGELAPFHDADGDGLYDATKGDYPVIRCKGKPSNVYGDQMVFWVLNDVGNSHTATLGVPIGVQLNSLAFAFQSNDEVNDMTFYNYSITNKSPNALYKSYMAQWVDPDLGYAFNDRVGCDTTLSLGYVYNGTTPDPDDRGNLGYGTQLPILGIDFFEGPKRDTMINGHDTLIELGLTSFAYFTNSGNGGPFGDPSTAAGYRNYMQGLWNDGSCITIGGPGHGGTVCTKFCFPGNPGDPTAWSECTASPSIAADDRRFVQSSGPFTMKSGDVEDITLGVVFVRPAGGVGLCPDLKKYIYAADIKAQALFDGCFQLTNGPDAPTLSIREQSNKLIINLTNDIASNNYQERYTEKSIDNVQKIAKCCSGVTPPPNPYYYLQGYRVYQLKSDRVSLTDLSNTDKAKLVAQVDIQDSITKIINYVSDPSTGLPTPVLETDNVNAGIKHSFEVTQDLFASGSSTLLVNNKIYYYAAIAYGYNNFMPYNPVTGLGQDIPYLAGRGNYYVYSAIPHMTDSRNNGTIVNSAFGDGTIVKRVEGQGNGGNEIAITPATIQKILGSSGIGSFADTLEYTVGNDPIGFKVIDPILLKEADFELQFVDSATGVVRDSSMWVLKDLTNNVTINSERDLTRPNEQIIQAKSGTITTDYGFSIRLGNPFAVYQNDLTHKNIYGYLSSSLLFTDSTAAWLSFVKNGSGAAPTKWIRSGTTNKNPDNGFNSNKNGSITGVFTDSSSLFANILNGTFAPYCLAANYAYTHPGPPPLTTTAKYVYGPGFKWYSYEGQEPPLNTLENLASVDIVLTSDKSKWTQCVVFETGEDETSTEGDRLRSKTVGPNDIGNGARKGQIRMHYSWDAASNSYITTDTGRSWFPGYAINIETGERLNIAFGEASEISSLSSARDMIWNPSNRLYSDVVVDPIIGNYPYFGERHFIYVMKSIYDNGLAAQQALLSVYSNSTGTAPRVLDTVYKNVYNDIMYAAIPYITSGYALKSVAEGLIPNDVTIKIRVAKPYNNFVTNATPTTGNALPRYQFSTKGLGSKDSVASLAKSALDEIRVVPNPYLGYSAYETSQIDNKVRITNLPNHCTVSIYSIDGQIIKTLRRNVDTNVETTSGANTNRGDILLEAAIDWDLKNEKLVPVSSGIYIVHVDAPGIGEKTVKCFVSLRPTDVQNF